MRIVVAIGGNMISDASKKGESFEEQLGHASKTAKLLANIIEQGHELVLTHGNGPQVGSLLLRQQAEVADATSLPLNVLGALTQGQIGVMLQHALINELHNRGVDKQVVIVPTTVIVDGQDPGFTDPTKPIGPFFSEEDFSKLEKKADEVYKLLPKGHRRVVASPMPIEILEYDTINLLSNDKIVIAVGGGGSPTVRNDNQLKLVDAVIDKDLASAVLARKLGADMLVILTNIAGVYKNFNTPEQELVSTLTVQEANEMLEAGALGKGSMGPKVRAGILFSDTGNTLITDPDVAMEALEGKAGTKILKSS